MCRNRWPSPPRARCAFLAQRIRACPYREHGASGAKSLAQGAAALPLVAGALDRRAVRSTGSAASGSRRPRQRSGPGSRRVAVTVATHSGDACAIRGPAFTRVSHAAGTPGHSTPCRDGPQALRDEHAIEPKQLEDRERLVLQAGDPDDAAHGYLEDDPDRHRRQEADHDAVVARGRAAARDVVGSWDRWGGSCRCWEQLGGPAPIICRVRYPALPGFARRSAAR